MDNKVTISLFSTEQKDGTFNEYMFGQKDNIRKMMENFTAVAEEAEHEPPKFTLSVLLVPFWDKEGNGYDNEDYLKTQKDFMTRVIKEFEPLGITVQDFYHEAGLTPDEKAFMHELRNNGSNADIIKTKALVNNAGQKHLQLDSNTIIHDYQRFYQHTFGMPETAQKDALVANYYTNINVSANNKVVYTTPNSKAVPLIKSHLAEYTAKSKEDAKQKSINAIYEQVFAPALSEVGIVDEIHKISEDYRFFSANLKNDEFRITGDIVTAINMSWASAGNKKHTVGAQLKKLPTVQVGDANCDFASFAYLIRKYTARIPQVREEDAELYDGLLSISDRETDFKIIKEFYNNAIKHIGDDAKLAKAFARIIPDTMKGNVLANALFLCSVKELHANPQEKCRALHPKQIHYMVEELSDWQYYRRVWIEMADRPSDYFAKGAFKRIFKERLNKDTILKGSSQEKVFNFFTVLQQGMDRQDFNRNIADILSLPTDEKERALSVLNHILHTASDTPTHLNYIENRETLLSLVAGEQTNQYTKDYSKRMQTMYTFGKENIDINKVQDTLKRSPAHKYIARQMKETKKKKRT